MPIRFTGCLFLQNYVCLYEAVVYVAGQKVVQGIRTYKISGKILFG